MVRVVIADQNPSERLLCSSTLTSGGYDVVAVSDGIQAMRVLDSEGGRRIAILDYSMPGAQARSICREIRKRHGLSTYIILLNVPAGHEEVSTPYGADDFLVSPFTETELRARIRIGARVLDLLADHIDTQRTLLKVASHDDLTGLWNRRMILDQMARELNRSNHDHQSLAVAMADIDLFKNVNDTYGHPAGDSVLRVVAAALRSHLRSCDFIGRYGGEEFLILLPRCDTTTGGEIIRRLCATIAAKPVHINDVKVPITVSFGLTCTVDVGFDSAALIAAADEALYRAKSYGRNCVA